MHSVLCKAVRALHPSDPDYGIVCLVGAVGVGLGVDCVCVCVCVSERQRERETDRQTD